MYFDLIKYMRCKCYVKLWCKLFSDVGKYIYISIIMIGFKVEFNGIEYFFWFKV